MKMKRPPLFYSSDIRPRKYQLLLLLVVMMMGIVIIAPATHAQTDEAGQTTSPSIPFVAPERLNPQVAGPAYNPHAVRSLDHKDLYENITAQPFTPQLRVQLGNQIENPLAGEKTAVSTPTDLIKDNVPDTAIAEYLGPEGTNAAPQTNQLQAQGWNYVGGETFDDVFANGVSCGQGSGVPTWSIEDYGNDGYDRTWGQDDYYVLYGTGSAWPAAGGADALDPTYYYVPDNLYSWMTCGPFDFSNAADIYADFFLWLDTEIYYDWFYFGASIDNQTFDVYYWSGYSDGWLYEPFLLTDYAGHSQVWLTWIYEGDESNPDPYEGAWVDDITIWSYDAPEPDPNGDLVQDGSFENGGQGWEAVHFYSPNGEIDRVPESEDRIPTDSYLTDLTSVDGNWSAVMYADGNLNDYLYQSIDIPPGVTDLQLQFWFAVTTNETTQGNDWFCASLTDPDLTYLIVDLGCMDATFTTGAWQEVLYTLNSQEVADAVAAGGVYFLLELYNRGSSGTGTAAWMDYVRFYGTGGSAGNYADPNEPNDDPAEATAVSCNTPVSATIGDVISGYGDTDWYRIDNVATGPLNIDINARTQSPPSELDSVVYLYAADQTTLVGYNDDDGVTYDSYLAYNNTTPNATYYAAVVSYDGYGGANSYYDILFDCAGGSPPTPPTFPTGAADTWTIMLYLNAEDPGFVDIVQEYITGMESVLAARTGFLTVAVLYDGPEDGDTVRYILQPNGQYTNGQNRWPLNEQNMGDRDTLAGFAKWAMDNYPAENYYLAVDDHGHGVYGISWDQTNGNDSLTPQETYSALKEATYNGERKISIFDYEACLMGMAENAYDVKDWVDYVVFFEQISWGLHTYPNYFSALQPSNTPLQIGQRIVNTYHTLADQAGYPHTISLIQTSLMGPVKQAVTTLGNALQATGNLSAVTAARNNSQAFAADNDATNPAYADYIDLWDLADKTKSLAGVSTAAAQVKTAVQNAVKAEQHSSSSTGGYYWNHSGAHGLSIYYPATNASSAFNDYINQRLFQMTLDGSDGNGRWDEFLRWSVTESGNGAGNGLGGDNRRGMTGARFLQPKFVSSTSFAYLPFIIH